MGGYLLQGCAGAGGVVWNWCGNMRFYYKIVNVFVEMRIKSGGFLHFLGEFPVF